eukprot:3312392-Rhodomonas_salina.1
MCIRDRSERGCEEVQIATLDGGNCCFANKDTTDTSTQGRVARLRTPRDFHVTVTKPNHDLTSQRVPTQVPGLRLSRLQGLSGSQLSHGPGIS